jgi:hypothetical protein
MLGVFFVLMARKYNFGSLREIGPGFFPIILGIVLMVLGVIIVFYSISVKGNTVYLNALHWKPIIVLSLSIFVFLAVIPNLGFILAVFSLLMISCFAYPGKRKMTELFLITVGLTMLAILVFIIGLKLPINLLPVFFIKKGM